MWRRTTAAGVSAAAAASARTVESGPPEKATNVRRRPCCARARATVARMAATGSTMSEVCYRSAVNEHGPLARLRAQLAGPRGARRVDALLSTPDPAAAVAALSVTEVYELVTEVGLDDASELVHLATPEQLRGCLDLEIWDRDQPRMELARPWLASIIDAGFEKLGQVWAGLDAEWRALFIKRHCRRIWDLTLGEEPDDTTDLLMYFTTDRFFTLELSGDEDTVRLVRQLVDDLYRADADLARHTIMSARSESITELEEESFR